MRKICMYVGVLFIFLALIWSLFLAKKFDLQPEMDFTINLIHDEDNRFDVDGQWSGNTISIGSVSYKTDKITPSALTASTSLKITSLTGDDLFSLSQKFDIDRITRLVISESNDPKVYFNFPTHLQRKSYVWHPSTFGGPFKVTYVGESTQDGLTLYHFKGQNDGVDDTSGYSFLPLVPEKYAVYSRAIIDVSVEPVSGTVVNYQDIGTSYYADENGNHVWDIANWGNRYEDETVSIQACLARNRMKDIRLRETGVSLLFLAAGVMLIYTGIRFHKKQKRPQS